MEEFRRRLIYLCHFPGISWSEVYKTLKKDPQLLNITQLYPPRNYQLSFTNSYSSSSYLYEFTQDHLHEQIRQYPSNGIKVITYFDDLYPPMLKEIFQPPWCLFLKGNASLLQVTKKLAIVGSRQATQYGKNTIRSILPPLIEKNITIVSGLAKGIDALAHQATIDLGGANDCHYCRWAISSLSPRK